MRFRHFAWGVLAYNLAVVLWGAFVRATGSGAGCGSHWPTCNGQVIPRDPATETVIEFTHRVTSGLALILVVALLVWAFREFPKGHATRKASVFSLAFIISEALVGAGLVLFGWVAQDTSTARAWVMSIHLVNTFLLIAALTMTAWFASGGQPISLRGQGSVGALLVGGLLAMTLLGVSGAVTALGDTLYPAQSLAEGLRADLTPGANFLIRLRVLHPILALIVGGYVAVTAVAAAAGRPAPETRKYAAVVGLLFVAQLLAGAVNVLLLAPVGMQLVHLLLADLVWIAFVLLTGAALSRRPHPIELPLAHPAAARG